MDPCVSPIVANSLMAALVFLGGGGPGQAQAEETSSPSSSKSTNLFGDAKPASTSDPSDRTPIELGLKFKASESGKVIGVRFYRTVADPKGHTVSLWTSKGRRIGTATIKASDAATEGWVEVKFSSPIRISPGETYVASYHTSIGQYPTAENGLSSDLTNGPLTALAGGLNGGNGVFQYGKGGIMPRYSSQNTHFFVDVMFRSDKSHQIAGKSSQHK